MVMMNSTKKILRKRTSSGYKQTTYTRNFSRNAALLPVMKIRFPRKIRFHSFSTLLVINFLGDLRREEELSKIIATKIFQQLLHQVSMKRDCIACRLRTSHSPQIQQRLQLKRKTKKKKKKKKMRMTKNFFLLNNAFSMCYYQLSSRIMCVYLSGYS